MKDYTTVDAVSEVSLTIKKSKFIARIYPIQKETEADEIIAAVKKEHYKATHVCSAWLLHTSPAKQKANDDGEPSGTAGKPILEVVQKRGLENVLVLVVRYFGGVKLGAGGLIRAYSGSAAAVIDATQLVKKQYSDEVIITIDYPAYGSLSYALQENKIKPAQETFDDKVHLLFYTSVVETQNFLDFISDCTEGRYEAEIGAQTYVDIMVD